MAVTLTASNSTAILIRANEMWNMNQTQQISQYSKPNATAEALLMRQRIRFQPVMDNAGRCQSFKVWYIDLSDNGDDLIYEGSTPDSGADCTIPAGDEVGSLSLEYAPNLYKTAVFQVSDDLCNNEATFIELQAVSLNNQLRKLRNALNTSVIQHINSAASANVSTNLFNDTWVVSGTSTEVPAADFNDESIFQKLDLQARYNRLADYVIIDGSNLYLNSRMAPFLGLNDSQRSVGAMYNAFASRYISDDFDLDATVGESATFLVNPNMFGFFNRARYGVAPEIIDEQNGLRAFSIEDPVLKYARTVFNPNGTITTTMEPVRYDVVYQRTCESGRDATGRRSYLHKWEITLEAGILTGPPGQTPNHTAGILKFVKQSGI